MGLCLIARTVFERLIAQGNVRTKSMSKKSRVHCFFDKLMVDNELFSEDLSFCRRWRDCGGTIRALLAEDIGHIGEYTFRGNYVDHLKAGATIKPRS
jgi:hypothetical protein